MVIGHASPARCRPRGVKLPSPAAVVLGGFLVMLQSFPHAHDLVNRITEPPVEINNTLIGSPNLQIDLRTTGGTKQPLRLRDHGSRPTLPLMLGRNRQIIQPAAMALETSHHTRNHLAVEQADQKQVRPHVQLASDVFARVVPRPNQATSPPKRNDGLLICWLEWSNYHEPVKRLT